MINETAKRIAAVIMYELLELFFSLLSINLWSMSKFIIVVNLYPEYRPTEFVNPQHTP